MVKKKLLIPVIALSIIILDQLLKYIISSTVELNNAIPVIGSFFQIANVHNYGAGFGIMQGFRWPFIFMAMIVIGAIILYYNKIEEKDRLLQITAALILGGTIGNLIDRIFLGYVVDFISFSFWPAFNVADSCLTVGAVGIIIWAYKKE